MPLDPRLADVTLLVLAAKRRRATRPPVDWRHTEGLFALLQAARALPPPGPWALPDLDDETGMGKLLREARARQ
jgi:hypothetical protein